MGNLIAGMVFFGIGTWPHCRRGRRDNILILQGSQGRFWMIRDRPKRRHIQVKNGPSG